MLPPLRNTHMTKATYYACIVYVCRYAAATRNEPTTFVQRSVSRARATLELEFWHRRIPTTRRTPTILFFRVPATLPYILMCNGTDMNNQRPRASHTF